jgi:hypothetical protein
MDDISAAELRSILRRNALVVGPGEVLVVTVPPSWQIGAIQDLMTALNAYLGPEIRALVVPGTAVTVARMPDDPFGGDDGIGPDATPG